MAKWLQMFLGLFCLSFVGCAQLGLGTETPASIDQKIAVAYTTVASVRNTAANLLNSQVISKTDGQMVLNMTNETRTALDIAKSSLKTNNTSSAQASLLLATDILQKLQAYLASKQEKK